MSEGSCIWPLFGIWIHAPSRAGVQRNQTMKRTAKAAIQPPGKDSIVKTSSKFKIPLLIGMLVALGHRENTISARLASQKSSS